MKILIKIVWRINDNKIKIPIWNVINALKNIRINDQVITKRTFDTLTIYYFLFKQRYFFWSQC